MSDPRIIGANGTIAKLKIALAIVAITIAAVILVPIINEWGNENNKIEVAENESSVATTTFKIVHAGGIPEVGETIHLEIVSNKHPLDSMRIEWSATGGALKADGKKANFTALSAGEITISAWIVGMEENASSKITLEVYDHPELQIICNSWMLSNDFMECEVVAKGVGPYKIWSDELRFKENTIFSSEPGIASIWVEAEALSDGRKMTTQKEIAIFQAIASGYNPPALGEKSVPILKNAQKRQVYLFLSEYIGEEEVIFDKKFLVEEVKAKLLFIGNEKGLRIYEDAFFTIPQRSFNRASVKGTDGRLWIIATDDKIIVAFPDCGGYRAGPARGGGDGHTSDTPPADSGGGSSGPPPDPDPRDPIPTQTPTGPSPTPPPTGPSPTPPPATPSPPATPVPTTPAPTPPTGGGGPPPDPNPRDIPPC